MRLLGHGAAPGALHRRPAHRGGFAPRWNLTLL